MTKPKPPARRTTHWRSYHAARKQRGSLLIWFDPETVWLAETGGKRGSSATFTDAAIQACLTLKAPSNLRVRTRGHGWRTPRARWPATTPSMPPAALAAPSSNAMLMPHLAA